MAGITDLLRKLERAQSLDAPAERLRAFVRGVVGPQRVRDVLHGVWLGHPLHPVIVQFPVGAWMSTAVLDVLPGDSDGRRRAATALLASGVAAAVPAAVTGANDWAELSREQRRVGLVHAAGNSIGLVFFTASLVERMRGNHGRGKALTLLGLTASGVAAYLGGHLSYAQGAGVNHAVPDLRRIPAGWQPLGPVSMVPDGEIVSRALGDTSVLVYRDGSDVSVLLAACAHDLGPLGSGSVEDVDGARCVVCPEDGSTFRLSDGAVVHGPAATDQPMLRSRVVEGRLEAALP